MFHGIKQTVILTFQATHLCKFAFIHRYIGPLREEAAGWAEKLKEVSEVLETWLEVQDLWQYLEAVFSTPETAKVTNSLNLLNQSETLNNFAL